MKDQMEFEKRTKTIKPDLARSFRSLMDDPFGADHWQGDYAG